MEPKIKTKVRFTSLDIAAMIQELKDKLVGCRITNIYDISPSTYLFKMSRGDDKHYLVCQNGMRFHTTEAKAEKNKMPSGFTMKFRKFLRSKRLEAIRQVGMQRVVVLTFGSDQFCNHLILELYSQGNIILTDKDYRIIQCIRTHQFNEKVKTAVGQLYPFELAANIYLENIDISQQKIRKIIQDELNAQQKEPEETQKKASKKKKQEKKQAFKLKDMIFKLIPCLFPQVIDHILLKANFNPNQKCSQQNLQMVSKAAEASLSFTKQFQSQKHKGYLVQNKEDFVDFAPYLHTMFQSKQYKTCDSFSQAVDTYYAVFKKPQEGDELQQLAWRKYEQIKKDQESRLGKLRTEQQQSQLRAQLIIKNLQDVDAVIGIFKRMLDEGYSWNQIDKMLQEAKKQGDPLANMIHSMNFQKGTVELLLGNPEEQLDDLVPVEVDVEYNAYTNASNFYESRKKNHQKELRTKEASEQVLKIAEREAVKDLEKRKNQRQAATLVTRKPYWFEKFYWFITTQNYLVVSGRDSHQNEMIVKKYMKAGDLYMHSDYGGAASTLIKNPTKEPVPRASLEQSAIFTVCRSKAWDTKIISGAWWVFHDQVSKSAPTGQFLPAGSFMIRGKRNFVYPNKMQMGITLLYRISADCVARHVKQKAEQLQEIAKLDNQKSEIQTAHEEKINEQEFAIISLEQAPKKTQAKKQATKQAKQAKLKPKKQPTKQQSDEESSEQEEVEEQKPKAKQQPKKKEPQQPKKPHVNKKKLKKLEKYLEQQDEEERQVIMKMLGMQAKEMKHMRDEEEEEEDSIKKKEKKSKKDKYNLAAKDEQQTIDKEKVLFLKEQVENKWTKGKKEAEIKKEETKKEEAVKNQEAREAATKQEKQEEKSTKEEGITTKQEAVTQHRKQQTSEETKEQPEQCKPDKIEQVKEVKDQAPSQQTPNEIQQKISQSSSQGEQQEQQKKQEAYDEDDKALDQDINELTRLVGRVYPEDTFDCLITMCAPYPTITENHFKIKLTPGGLKKGKAARNILHYFSTVELTEKEKPILKTYPEQEVINALLGNVKLGAAGMLKLEMKQKAQKKEKRKEKDKQKSDK